MELKPLNKKIGKLVDTFLDTPEYYSRLEDMAQTIGVVSDNPDVIKMAAFTHDGTNLGFASEEIENLFFEWQLFKLIADQEPYATLLETYPERKPSLITLAKKMWIGIESIDEDIINLFKEKDLEE